MIQHKTRIDYTNVVIVAIALFITGILVGAVLMPIDVFGQATNNSSLIPASYYETLNITKDAANQTEGYTIDKYVEILTANLSNFTGIGEGQ